MDSVAIAVVTMATTARERGLVPDLLELDPKQGTAPAGDGAGRLAAHARDARDATSARSDLRRQIARLERQLGELFATAFPRRGIEWGVAAEGGPRVLGIAELERTRDRSPTRSPTRAPRWRAAADEEEEQRELVERMIADPAEHRWVRVPNEDVGEPGCKHWHSSPRWGIIGMFLGWWRVKLSSGCPLAPG